MKSLYFFAIIPPKKLQEDIQELKRKISLKTGAKHALKTVPHITLVPPFSADEETIQQINENLLTKSFIEQSFEVQLNGYNHFRKDVFYIDVVVDDTLRDLASELNHYLNEIAPEIIKLEDRPYHPHVTLAFRDLNKEAFNKIWKEFENQKYIEEFEVSSFWLLHHENKIWVPKSEYQ